MEIRRSHSRSQVFILLLFNAPWTCSPPLSFPLPGLFGPFSSPLPGIFDPHFFRSASSALFASRCLVYSSFPAFLRSASSTFSASRCLASLALLAPHYQASSVLMAFRSVHSASCCQNKHLWASRCGSLWLSRFPAAWPLRPSCLPARPS